MERSELSDVINFESGELDAEFQAKLLGGLEVNTYWSKTFSLGSSLRKETGIMNTGPLMAYIRLLMAEGLDIGKGDAEFGYKMPVPEKDAYSRELQIFRRYDVPLEEAI